MVDRNSISKVNELELLIIMASVTIFFRDPEYVPKMIGTMLRVIRSFFDNQPIISWYGC